MSLIKRFFFLPLLFLFFTSLLHAATTFTVKRIEFKGLQRIQASTVRSYLPIHEGQRYTAQKGNEIINVLYKTGFFRGINIEGHGNTLIIIVKERPTISLIQITGNKEISSDKLKPVLKHLGIVVGEVFNPAKLHDLRLGLEQQYGIIGYHATSVTTEIKPLSRNRVALYIHVNEGPIAKVRSIKFVGNQAFSRKTLLKQIKLTTSSIFTWVTHNDRYSKDKLAEDIRRLNNFYLNHGYIRFHIVSQKATLTPDHKGVAIVIVLSEGPLYRISGYTVTGDTHDQQAELFKLVTIKQGDVFSREDIQHSVKAMGNYLADRGYAYARANVKPKIDDKNNTVFINFELVSGKRIYVNRVNIYGNQSTNEEVVRRELRQMEGGSYSLSKVQESKHRLAMLPYFDANYTKVSMEPVTGTNDEVDLGFHVKEQPSGRASVSAGYSDAYGFLYGAGITDPNFLGSGNQVGIGFQNSEVTQSYFYNYYNPYYTVNGVGRGYGIYYNREKYSTDYGYQPYNVDTFGTNYYYSLPLTANNRVNLGVAYEHTTITDVNLSTIAPSVSAFLNGKSTQSYNIFKATASWSYANLDRIVFPTKGGIAGLNTEIGIPVLSSSLAYYKAGLYGKYYQPVGLGFVLNFTGTVAYGGGYGNTSRLPFFLNYYGGGIDGGLPGYDPNTLGPKNANDGTGSALGGNFLVLGGFHLILPQLFTNKMRVALTLDAGNVFQTPIYAADNASNGIFQNETVSLRNIRATYGIMVTFNLPFIHQIGLSLAFPINKKAGDDLEAFQFSLGGSF